MSRYADVPTTTVEFPDGSTARVRARRFVVAPPTSGRVPAEHRAHDDRHDLLAARILGDPTAWWLVCDANGALTVDELDEDHDRPLLLPRRTGTA